MTQSRLDVVKFSIHDHAQLRPHFHDLVKSFLETQSLEHLLYSVHWQKDLEKISSFLGKETLPSELPYSPTQDLPVSRMLLSSIGKKLSLIVFYNLRGKGTPEEGELHVSALNAVRQFLKSREISFSESAVE